MNNIKSNDIICGVLAALGHPGEVMDADANAQQTPGTLPDCPRAYVKTTFADVRNLRPNLTGQPVVILSAAQFAEAKAAFEATLKARDTWERENKRTQTELDARKKELSEARGIIARNGLQRLAGETATKFYITADDIKATIDITAEEIAAGNVSR